MSESEHEVYEKLKKENEELKEKLYIALNAILVRCSDETLQEIRKLLESEGAL